MSPEEAIQRCAFWTTLGEQAIGSTTDPEIGAYFGAADKDTIPAEQFSDPKGRRVYAISVPRYVTTNNERVPNLLYGLIEKEIERRGQNG